MLNSVARDFTLDMLYFRLVILNNLTGAATKKRFEIMLDICDKKKKSESIYTCKQSTSKN